MAIAFHGATVQDCIEFHCEQAPEAPCFSLKVGSAWKTYTRAAFWREVEAYAAMFSRSEPGVILFIKSLDLGLLAAYIGAMKAGHLPAQLSYLSGKVAEREYQRKIEHILALTGAKAIFTDRAEIARCVDPLIKVFFPFPEGEGATRGGASGASDSALVQFSSGSTGLQKGVVLSHRGLIAHMKNYSQALGLSEGDSIATWLPLYHDMGLIACFLMPLMCGIPFFQMDPFDWIMRPDGLLETIERERNTLCFLPNFAYHVLINKGRAHDLSSMRLFVNCSEPARRRTHQDFLDKFPLVNPDALTVCYALAENTFAATQSLPGKSHFRTIEGKEVLSCGPLVPGTEIAVFGKNGEGVGEIGIRGEFLFQTFLNDSLPLRDGYYLTGDLGCLAEEGELFVTGRKKDIVIVNGKNIYPQDVEQICSEVPGVHPGRAAAFGVYNVESGSEDLVVLVESNGSVEDNHLKIAVQRSVAEEIGLPPRRVEIVEHMRLVKTSSGKISRARNKELYLNGELGKA